MINSSYFADISSNNGTFNAQEYASAGHHIVSIKATESTGYTNPYYAGWVHSAHQHGLKVMHYHFARPENGNPDGQARHFWDHVKPHWVNGDYVVCDLETGSPSGGANWLREFDRELKHLSGTHPICYTFLSYFMSGRVQISSGKIWLAAWGHSRPGNSSWKLPFNQTLFAWQYTDGLVAGAGPSSFAGIGGTCDGSLLNPWTAKEIVKAKPKHKQVHHKKHGC